MSAFLTALGFEVATDCSAFGDPVVLRSWISHAHWKWIRRIHFVQDVFELEFPSLAIEDLCRKI
jgi:hypothetical protein